MNIIGAGMDLIERFMDVIDDPESHPAGYAEPHYSVSEKVKLSRDHGLYVYHVADNQLGQGSSLGNARVWAETKGNGDMLHFFSIEAGQTVMGGLSVTYHMPFSDLSIYGSPQLSPNDDPNHMYTRAMPSEVGVIHLHPAFQQREFIIGDGLHILETFFLPRIDLDDPALAYEVVSLKNMTSHPIVIVVIISLDLRGWTPIDLYADFDKSRNAIIARNESNKDWVRVFGSLESLDGYWATNQHQEAYSPRKRLPDKTEERGNLTAALEFKLLLYPDQRKKIRTAAAFSPKGKDNALKAYDWALDHDHALKETIEQYKLLLGHAVVEMPDDLLTHGIQWAKACMARPVSAYAVGTAVTNNPGHSTNIVGRDTAWYIHGCDFVKPSWACSMLHLFARYQREDGLIAEYIDGNTGKTEDYNFNINDNTPLFIIAVDHHIKSTDHKKCLEALYPSAKKAGDLILSQRDEQGLVKCNASGMGPEGICGWRNVLQYQQITGVITEINAECYAALRALADLASTIGHSEEAAYYQNEAENLKTLINRYLIDKEDGLYILNIDLQGNRLTQATCDLVFPLMFGVADQKTADIITARLSEPDFMTEAGIRVLPSEDPHYDPSFESGCMGGVWQGVTWWYAVSSSKSNPKIMAQSLRRAYSHYLADPNAYNTVPGQFSEWSDGQTLVNRGMRLSPWDSPRFLWSAIEGLAGIRLDVDITGLDPRIPNDWQWLKVHNVLYKDTSLSFFLTREQDGFHVYTSNIFKCDFPLHKYDEELSQGIESITTGISTAAFRKYNEILICLGSSLGMPAIGPFLAHHAINKGEKYRVFALGSHNKVWKVLGTFNGSQLQRIVVRIEERGYVLYRFISS